MTEQQPADHDQQTQQQQQLLSDPYSSSLVCGVCLDDYKDPRALPCLHTFCHECLTGMHKRSRGLGLTCPCCREVCHARPSELRRNFHVARLQEMRPLLAMGIGLAEDFAGKARTQLAGLPDEAALTETVGRCREELGRLRAGQRSLEDFLDDLEAAVRSERESARELYAAAKTGVKAQRQWAKDCLARRSVSARLIDCAKSARHQTLLDLIEEFRLLKCDHGPPPEEPLLSTATSGQPQLPKPNQVRRRLAARLSIVGQRIHHQQPLHRKQQQQQQQQQQQSTKRNGKRDRRARKQQQQQQQQKRQRRLAAAAAAAAAFVGEFSDGDDSDSRLFVHPGLAGYMYYGDD